MFKALTTSNHLLLENNKNRFSFRFIEKATKLSPLNLDNEKPKPRSINFNQTAQKYSFFGQ